MTIEKALKDVIDSAVDLIAAIDDTTDQFQMEVAELHDAIATARQFLKGGAQ
jgi:hypothetical protein